VLSIKGKADFHFETQAKSYRWSFVVVNIDSTTGIVRQDFINSQGRSLGKRLTVWETKGGRA